MLKCPNCGKSNSFWIKCEAIAWISADEKHYELSCSEIPHKGFISCNDCSYIDYYNKFKVEEKQC